eukprot:scaffold254175_cov13-Tisochrysis_lutea.AAC.1
MLNSSWAKDSLLNRLWLVEIGLAPCGRDRHQHFLRACRAWREVIKTAQRKLNLIAPILVFVGKNPKVE